MVSTVITFNKANVHPPVFIAGEFTEWQPIEMSVEATEDGESTKNTFSYRADLEPGDYQYKFRLGPGDWWVLDESAETATDESGNVNNKLGVTAENPKPSQAASNANVALPTVRRLETNDAHITDVPKSSAIGKDLGVKPAATIESKINTSTKVSDIIPTKEEIVQKVEAIASIVTPRKDSIPDVAPPPYSIATNGSAQGSVSEPSRPETPEAAPEKGLAEPKEGSQSWIASICSVNGVITVIGIVAVPIAVSYLLRR